eukprot:scaffold16244_cov60-Phaeocystis_antarctica.AAC.5
MGKKPVTTSSSSCSDTRASAACAASTIPVASPSLACKYASTLLKALPSGSGTDWCVCILRTSGGTGSPAGFTGMTTSFWTAQRQTPHLRPLLACTARIVHSSQ